MAVDELQAFQIARQEAQQRHRPWGPGFYIVLENGIWQVFAEVERNTFIDAETGQVISDFLDPFDAFSIARNYAKEHKLHWRPMFSLQLHPRHWEVGACQSQLGGQLSIDISHSRDVLRHSVNPK